MVDRTLLQILREPWLINPRVAEDQLHMVQMMLNGTLAADRQDANDNPKAHAQFFVIGAGGVREVQPTGEKSERGLIAAIHVEGVLLKHDGICGQPGMARMASLISDCANNPAVEGMILKIDSPGGSVNGVHLICEAIKASHKPVVGFIEDGMACSAAYWIASSCDHVMASKALDEVGSIGVYTVIADYTEARAQAGVKVHEIYADQSSEKNKIYKQVIAGNPDELKSQVLNPLAANFIEGIKANREGKLDLTKGDPFKGAVYMASQALEIGLIDEIGSFQRACEVALSLSSASSQPSIIATNSSDMNILLTQASHAAIMALLGSQEESVELSAESLITQLEAAAAQHAAQRAEIQQQLQAANDSLVEAQTAQEQSAARIGELETEVETLSRLTGQTPTNQPKGPDKIDPASEEFMTETDLEVQKLRAEAGI